MAEVFYITLAGSRIITYYSTQGTAGGLDYDSLSGRGKKGIANFESSITGKPIRRGGEWNLMF